VQARARPWGEQIARQSFTDAEFVEIDVHDVPDDPVGSVYVARKVGELVN
jgi:hypothetical protein